MFEVYANYVADSKAACDADWTEFEREIQRKRTEVYAILSLFR